jgi:hypothetical protein
MGAAFACGRKWFRPKPSPVFAKKEAAEPPADKPHFSGAGKLKFEMMAARLWNGPPVLTPAGKVEPGGCH